MEPSHAARYHPKPGIIETDLEDELVLLDPVTRKMFTLNSTGRVAWRHFPDGIEATVTVITAAFAIPAEEARADVLELVGQLQTAGLIMPDA